MILCKWRLHVCFWMFLFFPLTLSFSYSLVGNQTGDNNAESIHVVSSCLKEYSYPNTAKCLACTSVSRQTDAHYSN